MLFECRQAHRVPQAILEDKGNERRRYVDGICDWNEQDEKSDGDSSVHHVLLSTIGIGCFPEGRIFASPTTLKRNPDFWTGLKRIHLTNPDAQSATSLTLSRFIVCITSYYVANAI